MSRAADDYRCWKFKHDLLEAQLERVEAAERAILGQIGCPVDVVAIYEILAGRRPAPWPKRVAKRDKQRALHAMHALIQVENVRRHTACGAEDAAGAAEAALMVGALANDALIRVEQGARLVTVTSKKGGDGRGREIAKAARGKDPTVARLARQWRISDELQEQYGARSPVNYIRKKTRFSTSKIQRSLKRQSRQ